MADKLLQYYKYISDNMGLTGRTKLAMATKVPSNMAAIADDSPENLATFRRAIEELTGKPAPVL